MCAIIGFHTDNPNPANRLLLARLFAESKIRGLHAFGVAYPEGGQWRVIKTYALTSTLNHLGNLKDVGTLVGHARYSTSGDWRDHRNNQPVVRDGRILVFNGIISMKTKAEMEAEHGVTLESDNDGELFLLAPEPEVFVAEMRGAFAGLFSRGGDVWVLRNTRRPMWWGRAEGAVYVASTRDILHRAGITPGGDVPPFRARRLCDLG